MDVAHQAPLSMGFPRQEYWSGLPCPSPRDQSPVSMSPALAGGFFTTEPHGRLPGLLESLVILSQRFSTRGDSALWGHAKMSRGTLGCHMWAEGCYWHPEGRAQGCHSAFYKAQDGPVLQRLRKPALSMGPQTERARTGILPPHPPRRSLLTPPTTNHGHQERGEHPSCDIPILPHSPKELHRTKAMTQITYPEKPATICTHVNQ